MLTTIKIQENNVPSPDHNVWVLLFEQASAVLRWVLIVLTGGILISDFKWEKGR